MNHTRLLLLAAFLSLITACYAQATELCVKNLDGSPFCLSQPAQRMVSLAPHLTEMVFAVGAGAQLVGVVDHSDFPPAARALPNLGGYHQPDMEKLLSLKPDLVLAWHSGASPAVLDTLHRLGLKVWVSRGEHIADIPLELRGIGILSGHPAQSAQAAEDFERELHKITQQYAHARPVRGFYQIWPQPLVTVSDGHFIAEAMRYCGIQNIVGTTSNLSPTWSEEAVLRARPELILTSPPARDFERWTRWPELPAVKNNALIILPPDVLMRPTPRIIEGIRAMCAAAERVRASKTDGFTIP
ncbi:MAG: cobalamin-binding protein [Halothiobacillaceae bacterium]|nr:cobalamin-binding protein [Halothiobacillaceae bacterium]